MPVRFDLQSHSVHSDGALAAAEVVARAASAGVGLLALTDHDTVGGVAEALAAGVKHGVRVVPAIEISARDDLDENGGARELHILGYRIDHLDPTFASRLAEFLTDREQRTLRMADGLRRLGLKLDDSAISTRAKAGRPIGRPHLAEAVLVHPANEARLRAEAIDDVGSLIQAYLIEGRPAFSLRATPTVQKAVQAIHDAGGLAVWAHPFWELSDPGEVIVTLERLHALGIDGVEAFYITHTREQTELLARRCSELGMLSTGSADFHGPEHRLFSRFLAFQTYDLEPNLGAIAG
jgi:3',5'-nucleoside bisphosphate phosphatase